MCTLFFYHICTDQIIKSNVAVDIVQTLGQFLETEKPFDIVITSGEEKFKCSKLLLTAYSGYFRTAFSTQLNENVNDYPLNVVSGEVFKLILQAMYTGCNIVTEDNVIEMMKAADYLNIVFLENECIRFIDRVKSSENCMEFYIAGTKYNSEKVKRMVWPIIVKHFDSIHLQKNFLDLSQDDLSKLFQDENLVTKSEDNVVEAILIWVEGRDNMKTSTDEPGLKRRRVQSELVEVNDDTRDSFNSDNREETLLALFTNVRLFLISKKYLEKLIEHPFVKEYSLFKDLIIKALSHYVFINKRDVNWPPKATLRKYSPFEHSVFFAFKKRTNSFEIKAHLIESNRWIVIPNRLSKTTTLKLATIDTSLYAFSRRPSPSQGDIEGGARARKRSIIVMSQYLNGKWSDIVQLHLASKNFSVVAVDGFLYILSPFGKKCKIGSFFKKFYENGRFT
uniref:BTB domain-containing protein n=1 Tax=Biomphalaria glabrata TaxID=6526 RepID=A0A2C9LXS3_BIOGL